MIIPREDKFHIAAKASFVHERLAGMVIPTHGNDSSPDKYLERWQRLINGKDTAESFEKRIKLTGMTIEQITPFLGSVEWNSEKPLPAWISVLEEVFSYIPIEKEYARALLPSEIFLEAEPLPFEDLWLPWLLCAARKIQAGNPDLEDYFSEKAFAQWLRSLLAMFVRNMTLPLLSTFDVMRNPGFFFMPGGRRETSASPGTKKIYCEFIDKMLAGEMQDLFRKYPVAARIASTMLENFISYSNSIMESLRADMKNIEDVFSNRKKTGLIANIKASLSDPHHQGRTVIEFAFENNLRLIYKPRSFDLDKRWEKFLRWCSAQCPEIDFKYPRHVGDADHVWVECLEHSPLEKLEEAEMFYRRCGALLATAYVLNGYDFHQENLLACGQYPVLIDLETVLRPLVRIFNYDEMEGKNKEAILDIDADSVLRTSFLPMWIPVSKDLVRDYGALTPDDNVNYTVSDWLEINTDRMRREKMPRKTEDSPNVPEFNGRLINVTDYIKELLDGFTEFYKLFMQKSDSVPFEIFKGAILRYLPRNSQIYADMTCRLMSPALLRDGAAFSIELEGMGQPFIHGVPESVLPKTWKIFEMERAPLEILNIPLFEAHTESTAIFENTVPVLEDYYLLSALDEVKRRLKKLSPEDLDFQRQLIEASLACRYPGSENDTDEASEKILAESLKAPLPDNEFFINAAAGIAAEIAGKVIRKDKNPQWLTQKLDPVKHFLNIGPVDSLLYEGSSGIGLFLSAYSYVTGDDKYRSLAKECFGNMRDIIEDENIRVMAKWTSVGYAGGMAGMVWAADTAAGFLGNDKELKQLAAKALDVFSDEAIHNDQNFDILYGSAGGLACLLEFYNKYKEKRLLSLAVKCGEHLLSKRTDFKGVPLWQANFASRPLCGLGHGLAGHAYALLKLFAVTKDERFRDAAANALNYETDAYMEDAHNWPDFRTSKDMKETETGLMFGWCSGAPGIGMGRLMTLDIMDNEQIRKDIENAIMNVKGFKFMPHSPDHLCCGFAGRIDFLIEAALRLERPELMDEARRQLSFVVNRAQRKGFYTFKGTNSKAVFAPGFFSGIAGVAYTALRMAKPELLPTMQLPCGVSCSAGFPEQA